MNYRDLRAPLGPQAKGCWWLQDQVKAKSEYASSGVALVAVEKPPQLADSTDVI